MWCDSDAELQRIESALAVRPRREERHRERNRATWEYEGRDRGWRKTEKLQPVPGR